MLTDHPDELCNQIIQNLTCWVFTRKPQPLARPVLPLSQTRREPHTQGEPLDVGDRFHLSQLLFIMGHVAIKHIVFLELVEREWKRQKDEKELGASRDYSLKNLIRLLAMLKMRLESRPLLCERQSPCMENVLYWPSSGPCMSTLVGALTNSK